MFRKSCSTFLVVGQFEFLLLTDTVEKLGKWAMSENQTLGMQGRYRHTLPPPIRYGTCTQKSQSFC